MASWRSLLGALVLLLILVSCKSNTPNLKPEKEPEAYNLPPLNDKRYVNPIQYPEDVLNDDGTKKSKKDNTPGTGMGSHGGMGGFR